MIILKQYKYYFLTLFIVLVCIAILRPINYDEAYYIQSAGYLIKGKLPYTDFNFHQPPLVLLNFIFQPHKGFISLIAGRTSAIILTFISIIVYSILVNKLIKNKSLITIFLLFIILNFFFLDWCVVIKPYPISIFIIGCILFMLASDNSQFKNIFIGVLITLLILIKLSYIPLAVIFMIYSIVLISQNNPQNKKWKLLLFLISAAFPLVVFFIFYSNNFEIIYFNLFEFNIIDNTKSMTENILKLIYYFIVPQNFLLLIIILFSGIKYNKYEKLLLTTITIYIISHLMVKLIPEYLTTIFPLIALLAALRTGKFRDNIIKYLNFNKVKEAILVLYIFLLPFGVIYIKNAIQNKDNGINPLQLNSFSIKLSNMNEEKVLSSWLGYYVFSNKISVLNDDYISSFLNYRSDDVKFNRQSVIILHTIDSLVSNKIPDIIIYDNNNAAYLETFKERLIVVYPKYFIFNNIIVYHK